MSRPTDTIQVHIGADYRQRFEAAVAAARAKHVGPASEAPTISSIAREAVIPAIEALEARASAK